MFHLCKQPAPGYNCVSLKEFLRCLSAHLRRDYAGKVILHAQNIYGAALSVLNNKLQTSFKHLVLFSLPMEVHANDNISEPESSKSLFICRFKEEFRALLSIQKQSARLASQRNGEVAGINFSLCVINAVLFNEAVLVVEGKINLVCVHYTHAHLRLFSHFSH